MMSVVEWSVVSRGIEVLQICVPNGYQEESIIYQLYVNVNALHAVQSMTSENKIYLEEIELQKMTSWVAMSQKGKSEAGDA